MFAPLDRPLHRTLRIALSLCASALLALGARASDTIVLADGGFGAGWMAQKILDTTPGASATFTATTLPGGPGGAYREISHTWSSGAIVVFHHDPAYVHQPAIDPICAIDFYAGMSHVTGVSVGGAFGFRLGIEQGGTYYGGPPIDVYLTAWGVYSQFGLKAVDFVKWAGSGPDHPDFTCAGAPMQFGFLTLNSANGGPFTKIGDIDDWTVTLHLARNAYSDNSFSPANWSSTKIVDTTAGSSATTSSVTQPSGGNLGAYRETTHTWTSGAIVVAHLTALAFHSPSTEPIYTVDFSADLAHLTALSIGGAVGVRACVLQGSGWYGSPTINVFSNVWSNYAQTSLTANDFVLVAGTGPLHPDFSSTGSTLQFGYITSNSASGGPVTKVVGIDNWAMRVNLTPPCSGTLGIPVCFGDDITNPCPCFATTGLSFPGHGCPNSIESRGALLIATGTASIANDTAILHGSLMPDSFCLYFQGTLVTGTPFGDGRLCVGGSIVRLAIKLNACTSSQYPAGLDPSLSVQGLVTSPGQRIYQIWYRDAVNFCTTSTFNLTNALAVNWTL